MVQCYLGLGSNLRSPTRQMHQAVRMLRSLPKTTIKKKSPFIRTNPLSQCSQPMYCNAVIEIATTLPPHILLRHCLTLEKQKGRVRKKHWGSRTLDIDILIYGTKIIQTPSLTIPHPGILMRDFVYMPLFEMAPNCLIFTSNRLIF